MNSILRNGLIGLLSVVILLAFVFTVVPISYQNSVADAETFVQTKVLGCALTMDNGIKSILETAQVDQNTKNFLIEYIDAASPEQKVEVDEAYAQFVSGNAQPFMMLMGTLSGTNLTATSENLQREIVAQRANMLRCALELNQSQKSLKEFLGYNAAGELVKFPQRYMNLKLSEIADPTLRDNDFDGRLTVLDYRPPVSVEVLSSFGSGVDNTGTLDIYKKP